MTVHGDVTDLGLIRSIITDNSVDTVFHLAAQTLTGAARQDPAGTLDVNVRGTWTVLEAARLTRQCQVLVASSGHVYGEGGTLPYVEESPLRGVYPYDVSKSCAELICTMYAATYALPTGILRFANLFGGRDDNFSRAIPGVIIAAIHGESFVIRSDGKAVRDYLYVEDATDALLRLAETLAQDRSLSGEAFNVSLELKMTVLEVVEAVLRVMRRTELKPTVLAATTPEIREQCLSAEKARRVLQWSPRYGMEEGLRETVRWYLNELDLMTQDISPAEAS
jgi:CDP-glucose 4,6-dehydratase